ncbi:MAG: electron transport complex subunit RsxC [Methylococcaceae bacterium]|jgi:electron transport complex protein RnfC
MANLWRFNGGLHLNEHKELSTHTPLRAAEIPAELVYPLQLRPGIQATPLVKVGERVLRGQCLADSGHGFATPIHASTSGIIKSIENRLVPHPSGLAGECLVLQSDGKDDALAVETCGDFRSLTPESVRHLIRNAGIVGLGGAAFPTAVKLAPKMPQQIDTLIINGAECEPYITCDDSLIRSTPAQIIVGAQILMHALGIWRCLIAVEDTMPQALAALQLAQTEIGDLRIEIIAVPTVYPTGGERQLIKVLTGKETPSGGIPADVGIVCQNAGTAAAVFEAIVNGKALTERIITVTGLGIKSPQNLRVRIGTPIKDLVQQCGGYSAQAQRLIMGGPMMGFALAHDDIAVVKASNCILVTSASEIQSDAPVLPCIRCGECANVCPVQLLPQQLYWHSRSDQVENCKTFNLFDCIECGCCNMVCPSHIPLVQYFRFAKGKLMAKVQDATKTEKAKYRHDVRSLRKQKEDLEKAERAKKKKATLEKMQAKTSLKEGDI